MDIERLTLKQRVELLERKVDWLTELLAELLGIPAEQLGESCSRVA